MAQDKMVYYSRWKGLGFLGKNKPGKHKSLRMKSNCSDLPLNGQQVQNKELQRDQFKMLTSLQYTTLNISFILKTSSSYLLQIKRIALQKTKLPMRFMKELKGLITRVKHSELLSLCLCYQAWKAHWMRNAQLVSSSLCIGNTRR